MMRLELVVCFKRWFFCESFDNTSEYQIDDHDEDQQVNWVQKKHRSYGGEKLCDCKFKKDHWRRGIGRN